MYDENGVPNTVYYYNGSTSATKYYYVLNLQGDVTEIRSTSNALVAQYNYDAFGNILSIKDANGNNITSSTHIANVNPLRYRGYFYDTETGFYYLNSRYYDPATRRFISADSIIDERDFNGLNLYAYCWNDPVNNSDFSGKIPTDAMLDLSFTLAKGAIASAVSTVQKTAKLINDVKEVVSNIDATFTVGVSGSATAGIWSYTGQVGLSIDTKGNIALQGTYGYGITGGTPGVSGTMVSMVTNAPGVDKLNGEGYQFGGSVGIPIYGFPFVANGEINIIPDLQEGTTYYGITRGIGVGTPGYEGHLEWTETQTMYQSNIDLSVKPPMSPLWYFMPK